MQQFHESKNMVAHATAIHAWQSLHQFALDGGSWKAAMLLSLLDDPFGITTFASTPQNLSIIAGVVKAK